MPFKNFTQPSLVLISTVLCVLAVCWWIIKPVRYKRIHGPQGLPFIGNLHQIPSMRLHPQASIPRLLAIILHLSRLTVLKMGSGIRSHLSVASWIPRCHRFEYCWSCQRIACESWSALLLADSTTCCTGLDERWIKNGFSALQSRAQSTVIDSLSSRDRFIAFPTGR